MGKRSKEGKNEPSVFDKARNELFSQIRHCGVLEATEDQREAWFRQTMEYVAKRYPQVTKEQLARLHEAGLRYCEPVIPHGSANRGQHEDTS
ncbi:MAG: hypothetical protein JSV41_00425 [Gemmatimonadota bacterium]|nr:MAG: hypothetical protein JSV41_00425 [Gemmatimonadota bacterium]